MIVPASDDDGSAIQRITATAGNFSDEEIECVKELWDEYLNEGPEICGYHFVVQKEEGQVFGYACYGPRALTHGSYDLYWIASDVQARRHGTGRALTEHVEQQIAARGGRLILVETSGMEAYTGTRKFYESLGYIPEAIIQDFYSDGDDLVIFTKKLPN
jgi:ribosomal protein S18 acetylase RimI-like enzyme